MSERVELVSEAFLEDSAIEYFCNSEYNPEGEVGISPFARDLDWSNCDSQIKSGLHDLKNDTILISPKDSAGISMADWKSHPVAKNFLYEK